MNYPGPLYLPPQPPVSRRRWPIAVAGAATGALITALVATLIVDQHETKAKPKVPATITATATPSAPLAPTLLPTAEADRHTCDAWLAAGQKIHDAAGVISVIPEGLTVLDPGVRDNPQWSAAVRAAGELYGRAGDILADGIAAGSPILERAAWAAAWSLRALSTADVPLDAANGNIFDAWKHNANVVNVLCDRLAPR